ncbi:MAG: CDP-paratose 2-epimerase [Phycisphaera sp.]|nr:CDP-paratose 2-epimerase [Phycisphaera sp.]
MSKVYTLVREQFLPRKVEDLFPFFADAYNLETLTPAWMHFKVLTPKPIEMKAGTLIDYKLRVRWLPLRWRTLIRAWEPPVRFVDEMLKGPYRQWVHEHTFTPVEGGTLCRDKVEYAVPGGELIHQLLVKRDVERIFDYREKKMEELFGANAS